MDNADHAVDFLAVGRQLADRFGRLLDSLRQAGYRALDPSHDILPVAREAVGTLRLVACFPGVFGDVVDSGGHLVDCSCCLVGFALLAEHALADLAHA